MVSPQVEVPTAAFFNPQSKAAEVGYLDSLHAYLHRNERLHSFVQAIRSLPETRHTLVLHKADLRTSNQGSRAADLLSGWIDTSDSSTIANGMSGSLTLPLLTIIQLCQYFQYLDFTGIKHSELLQAFREGGVHGYCGGLLPAVAVALSANVDDLIQNAAKALRLALAIGTYGDLGDEDQHTGPTNMAIRLKQAGQGEEIVRGYPGAYISAVTDPKTISIVGSARVLQQIKAFTDAQGMLSQGVHIRGKVHNPENEDLAAELNEFCTKNDGFRFPDASHLQVPLRSNVDGGRLEDESLTREVIKTILSTRCEWYQLLHNVAADLEQSGRKSHHLINFGIGDCLSPLPFHQRGLKITKSEARSIIKDVALRSASIHPATYKYPPKAVAVVGMACRYPGANNVQELWDVISSGSSMVQELPQERVDTQKDFRLPQDQPSVSHKKFYGNFIDRPDAFDHAFFGVNPREATYMDPQQRLLLETSYQAVESSGYLRKHKRGNGHDVGVFIGASFVEYLANTSSHPPTAYNSVGTLKAFLCGRISHYFGWTGPAEVIDTACSSSLVAINRAWKAIQSGECSMALAGGVNVISSIENFLDLGKAGFLSPTGQCKPFDKEADGYCRSEGVGLLFLKPLDQALRANDPILGVICGAATNQGGLSSSITVPHSPSQVTLYRKILGQAGMTPDQVSYVEAHGTGTQVGDPLEIASIREVFGSPRREATLYVGSIKGNIGHCETAAGVAGCIKALLLLQKGVVPPLASHTRLNPKIPDLKPDHMAIALRQEPWSASFRAVCVNSYGAAGSNTAVVLCQPPPNPLPDPERRYRINETWPFLLSADSKPSLIAYATDLRAYLQGVGSSVGAADVAYTLAEKRQHHRFRLVATGDLAGLTRALGISNIEVSETPPAIPSVVLVFPGQVSQVVGMKSALYESCGLVRLHLNRCNEIAVGLGISSLFPTIFQMQPISDVKTLHCCLFAQQYAFAQAWIESGLRVDTVVGHSFGELTALAVSGILSLEDALTLVAGRASLVESQWGSDPGAMLSVRCPYDTVKQVISDTKHDGEDVEIACYNADDSFVLGGTRDAIAAAEQVIQHDIRYQSVKSAKLEVTHAYHTRLAESILGDLDSITNSLDFKKPAIPFESSTEEHCDNITSEHIRDHLSTPVFFQNAIRRLEQRLGSCVWLEAGCDSPTFSLVKRAVALPQNHLFQAVKSGKGEDPMCSMCDITASLWREGVSVSYWGFHSAAKQGTQQVWLPPYHFQETRHWLPYVNHATRLVEAHQLLNGTKTQPEQGASVESPPLIKEIKSSNTATDADIRLFEINPRHPRFIDIVTGHAVLGRPLCPAGMYLEFAVLAARLSMVGPIHGHDILLENCSFESPLGLSPNRGTIMMSLRKVHAGCQWSFDMSTFPSGQRSNEPATHSKGHVSLVDDLRMYDSQRLVSRRVKELQKSGDLESLRKEKAYCLFRRIVDYSDIFKGISVIRFADTEAVAEVDIPHSSSDPGAINGISCDAVALDIFLQICGLLINSHDKCPSDAAYLAVGIDTLCIAHTINNKRTVAYTIYALFDLQDGNRARGDVYVLHEGQVVVTLTGVQFVKVPLATLEKLLDTSNEDARHDRRDAKHEKAAKVLNDDSHGNLPNRGNGNIEPPTASSGLQKLREIIASYTGFPCSQITGDSRLSTLGIDSLAAIELAEDLSSRFSSRISSTSLLEGNFQALCYRLGINATAVAGSSHVLETATSMTPEPQAVSSGRWNHSSTRQRLVELVCLHSGHSPKGITDEASLANLGVDSLARIELKADIEATFQTSINDNALMEGTTIKDVLEQVTGEAEAEVFNVTLPSDSTLPALSSLPLNTATKSPVDSQASRLNMDPIRVLAEIDTSFSCSAEKHGFTGFWNFTAREIDQLVLAYIVEALDRLGIDLSNLPPNESVPGFKSLPKHDQLVKHLWAFLGRFDLVRCNLGRYIRTAKPVPKVDIARLFSDLTIMFPEYAVDLSLLALTGPELANCLTGAADPLKLLFGSTRAQQTLSEFYHRSPMFATMTNQLLLFVKRLLKQRGSDVIRIIEIGAGFGGTTTALAKVLQESGRSVQYTFTDVAPTLVDKARKTFSRYSWMDFATLDLERDPPTALQGKYDMVIATNVVHATSNLVSSTRHLKALLRPGGFICLSEITKVIEWHNLVFGLLPGWWCFNDGRSYALQSAEKWMEVFRKAGFEAVSYSTGASEEAKSQQLLIGLMKADTREMLPPNPRLNGVYQLQTVVYKTVDGVDIHADVYFPKEAPSHSMPIALMIHGGGYMTLSKTAIRPAQTRFLLSKGILPISLDHRLCPEVNIIDGPMADVRDAVAWTRHGLPDIALGHGIRVDTDKVAVIGWSTGGHLAMTTAWTTVEADIKPPAVVLNLYGPSDFEALAANHESGQLYPARTTSIPRLRDALYPKPITSYIVAGGGGDDTHLGWLKQGDQRSELVLALFAEPHGRSLLFNGSAALDNRHDNPVTKEQIQAINPIAQVRAGKYHVPTFIIHGCEDDIVDCGMSFTLDAELRATGVDCGLCVVEGAGHVCDWDLEPGTEAWERVLGTGYRFLLRYLGVD